MTDVIEPGGAGRRHRSGRQRADRPAAGAVDPDHRPGRDAQPETGRAAGGRAGARRPGRGVGELDHRRGPALPDLGDDRAAVLPGDRAGRLSRAADRVGPGRAVGGVRAGPWAADHRADRSRRLARRRRRQDHPRRRVGHRRHGGGPRSRRAGEGLSWRWPALGGWTSTGSPRAVWSAADLHQKLHRIGKISFVWSDPHLALTSAAVLEAGDVAVGISHTGTTLDTVDALRVAHGRGATTIAITNFAGSPIAEQADLLLTTAARETTFRPGAMSSRIAQLALVDCLFAGVAQRSYDQAITALESTYAVVRSRHKRLVQGELSPSEVSGAAAARWAAARCRGSAAGRSGRWTPPSRWDWWWSGLVCWRAWSTGGDPGPSGPGCPLSQACDEHLTISNKSSNIEW